MRGKQSLCLFCRHTAQRPTRITVPRRFASLPNVEPSVLPRSDRETEESTFMRGQEDVPELEGLPVRRLWSYMEDGKEMSNRNATPKVALQTLKVTTTDLWAYALLGTSEFTHHPDSWALRSITSKRKIDPFDSPDSVAQALLQGFSIDQSLNLQRAGFVKEHEMAILDQMQRVHKFSGLRRIISMLSSTRDGCEFLSRSSTYILDAIRNNRKRQNLEKVTSSMVLEMLNNIHINLESKGLQIGPQLCNGTLYYASKSHSIAALKMYLQLARKHKYVPDWRARKALKSLSRSLAIGHPQLKGDVQKREALELITGWRGGVAPRRGELRMTCFAYLSYRDTDTDVTHAMYPAYIQGLGEMGLNNAIFAEFMAKDPKRMNPVLLGDEHLRFRAQMFAIAFLLAKDEEHALQALESVPIGHTDIRSPEDEKLMPVWRSKNSPRTHQTFKPTPDCSSLWLLSIIYDHYDFHDYLPTPDLQAHLAKTILQMSHEPQPAMQTLKSMLLLDSDLKLPRIARQSRSLRLLTLSEDDGKGSIRLVPKIQRYSEEMVGEATF
ncbi:hypothetical protein BKA65DRAFT_501520 [Rhexocercosporidium sp. MPI-PUGE-AT-0058]|nr:hypothetical protein BKA65DRAFT_501520 [Rhexocercosporidium sp. MPI-PUGE-AT-0058]